MSFEAGGSKDGGGAQPQFKAFVSEAQLEEKRKVRQEEWEKVRTPDQPLEAPEETYDPRSLFDRLQEQKDKKQAEFEEAHKLKNLIRGLDDEEVAFLELVDKTKIEMESKIIQEERSELNEYRKAVAKVSEAALDTKLQDLKRGLPTTPTGGPTARSKTQLNLLSQVVKRKSVCNDDTEEAKVPRLDSDETKSASPHVTSNGLRCLGVLPGLGVYTDSSDSDNSSLSENEDLPPLDLLGRRRNIVQIQTQTQNHA